MRYRKFGRLDWEISELSLGVLRLEELGQRSGEVRRETRIKTIRYAIDQGVNYINLGYPAYFEHPREACSYVQEALSNGYREKVKLAINIPVRNIKSSAELDRSLNEQLDLFGITKTDFCILDTVSRDTWEKLKEIDVDLWAKQIIDTGRVQHMGIAFRDDAYLLKDINDFYPGWAVVQMELSILDDRNRPGIEGLNFAEQYGNAVVAAETTKGGRLLKNIPPRVQEIWDKALLHRTPAEWCIRWVLGLGEVSSALFDFESVEQFQEYLSYAENVSAGGIDIWETLQAAKIRDAYDFNRPIQCTSCRRCMPCSYGVDIPRLVELYNDSILFSDDRIPGMLYKVEGHSEAHCANCLMCKKHCPKRLSPNDIVQAAAVLFTEDML